MAIGDMTNVTTGEVRLSYAHLFKPYSNIEGQEPKYSVTVLLPKTDTATKGRIDAAIEAAKIRLRPIVMTSLAFVMGCIPLAVASGAGAASRVTMGVTVVFGTSVATIFGVFIIPMLFIIIESIGGGKKIRDEGKITRLSD